jgi:hypothetical protein
MSVNSTSLTMGRASAMCRLASVILQAANASSRQIRTKSKSVEVGFNVGAD